MTALLFDSHYSSFYLLIKSLISAIRAGKISKPMARYIVRKLRQQSVPLNLELSDLIDS